MEFSKLQHNDAHMWERLTRWLCLPCGTAKVNITSSRSQLGGGGGGGGWAHNHVYAQVRAARWASLGARWLQRQQAGPGLIKDVGAQLELPTSARLAHAWLKAKLRSACAWEWPWGESKQSVWKTPKRSSRFCVRHQMDCTRSERKYCCCATAAICINPLPPSWINH